MLIEGLYKVNKITHNDSEIQAQISLNPTHDIFKGHFPGNPIMPGVCMMQVIKELTEGVLKLEPFLQTSTNIKFMAKINPELNPDLVLKIDFTEEDGIIKLKNNTFFGETLALKLNAKYKIVL